VTERLRWGILGTGGIAHSFVADLVLAGCTVQAVGSRHRESADAFAAEFGIPTAHASYEDLATDPDVDVVYVSTLHPLHAPNATLALNAGKHVLIEKPITVNAAEAEALADLAAEKNLLLLEAMWTRFLPHIARIREIIATGTLGEIRSVDAWHAQAITDDPAHRLNAIELGGGALLDMGIYPVSFAAHILGTPTTVQATARFRETGADAGVAAVFGYEGGQLATITTASDGRGPNTAVIVGSAARIEIADTWFTPSTFRVIAATGEVIESYDEPVSGRGMQFQAFEVERLFAEGRTQSEVLTPAESVSIMRTMDEIRRQIGLVYPGE
jgi:predicted dehydrogenase